MSSAPLLQLLATQARLSDGELAERLDMTEEAVRAQREQWEREGLIVGYQAVVNEEYEHDNKVAAFIEVKMTRNATADSTAWRCASPVLTKCPPAIWLAEDSTCSSWWKAKACGTLPGFVAEKLSHAGRGALYLHALPSENLQENGCIFEAPAQTERLVVAP